MRWILFCFWITLNFPLLIPAQQVELQFQLIDEATKKPILDAHIFISNSRIGVTSNDNGFCEINISAQESQVLVITHVLYETLIINSKRYHNLNKGATIEMRSKNMNLSEVVITAKERGKWKRNFKRFRKTLLGKGKAAANCKILNPEVLQFEEKNGTFWAKASDLLHIENDYLGYTIRFWLEVLYIKEDGSSYYHGYPQFIDQTDANDPKYNSRRNTVYLQSIPHFLKSLLESSSKAELKGVGYELSIERYEKETFKTINTPSDPDSIVQFDSLTGKHRLYFPEFLTVKHTGLKVSSSNNLEVSISSEEQHKFGASSTQTLGTNQQQHVVSRMYKVSPYLLFDRRGDIINKSAVRKYGYWAEQRLASTLPIDYNVNLDLNTKESSSTPIDTLVIFQNLVGSNQKKKIEALTFLQKNWSQSYVAPLLDILKLSQDDWQRQVIRSLLNEHVPEIKADFFNGIQWLWKDKPAYDNYYADFKGYVYKSFDPAFYQYFNKRGNQTKIRLDEIIWGGVRQDGIPPLNSPAMVSASQATYLSDTDVVFGLVINGEARAYPKRILAWHELFTDDIGEQSIAGVYCTLCGTVIIYDTEFNGVKYKLGTSGFLYRSNKLMYDHATQSLWSTLLGKPVVGPLVNQNIELSTLPVETTNWEEWRLKHPNTEVLSLETGHARNYAEDEAYKDYFADDNLMFPVLKLDKRLPNKTRVFIPRPKNFDEQPLAISVNYLKRKGIHQDQIEEQRIIIITEKNGASRAYAIDDQQFKSYKRERLLDNTNQEWEVTEDALISSEGIRLSRLPAHEAFWFAWINVFPETRIIY